MHSFGACLLRKGLPCVGVAEEGKGVPVRVMGRRVRDLREAQFRHPSEQKSLVFRDELRKTCYDFVINGIKVAMIL